MSPASFSSKSIKDFSHRRRIPFLEHCLVPIRIRLRPFARGVELGDLFGRELPADGIEILPQLLFVASADDHRRHRRATQQPIQRHLRHGLARFAGHRIERIDDLKQKLILDFRPGLA